ncbi:MAG: hypothetical protein IPH20_00140 [Bacteroidales bacterium]|nr:hypothetical protein [Bacteroidales bacterium]
MPETMKAVTLDSRTIAVYQEGNETGRLVYKNWYSSKTSLIDPDQHVYQIVPSNFWRTSFEVRDGTGVVITIRKKWNGHAVVETHFGSSDREFSFKHKGLFNSRYLLTDKDDREMLVVRTKFIWNKFRYNYDIEVSDSIRRYPPHLLIVTLMIYLCKEYISRQSSHGAAAG